jgi:hypothetical protein
MREQGRFSARVNAEIAAERLTEIRRLAGALAEIARQRPDGTATRAVQIARNVLAEQNERSRREA